MKAGQVKWFNDAKGYGFITDGEQDYFVHYTYVQTKDFKTLSEGQKVSFIVYETAKGKEAREVTKCE